MRWLVISSLVFFGCNSSEPKEGKPPEGVQTTVQDPSKAVPLDVQFIVDSCLESGEDEAKCKCLGEESKKGLGPELVAKMKSAPKEIEAASKHYTRDEMNKMMRFIEAAGDKCEIE